VYRVQGTVYRVECTQYSVQSTHPPLNPFYTLPPYSPSLYTTSPLPPPLDYPIYPLLYTTFILSPLPPTPLLYYPQLTFFILSSLTPYSNIFSILLPPYLLLKYLELVGYLNKNRASLMEMTAS